MRRSPMRCSTNRTSQSLLTEHLTIPDKRTDRLTRATSEKRRTMPLPERREFALLALDARRKTGREEV